VRFAYKNYPTSKGIDDWWAALPVQLSNPAKHSPPCRKFEAIIDSGAAMCIFHSSIGQSIGLNIQKGEEDETTGISGNPTKIYLHNVSLHIPGGHVIKIRAGFTDELPVAGLLGRTGFFEHFKITFDPSSTPPGFDLERIYKSH
jgi:hypothetical protein